MDNGDDGAESDAEQDPFGDPADHQSHCGSESMSDDSLSDDSFHPELGGTGGPITPPQNMEALSRFGGTGVPTVFPPAKGAVGSEAAGAAAGDGFENKGAGGFRYDFGTSTPPRRPLGAVADPGAMNRGFGEKGSGGGGGGGGGGIWDCDIVDAGVRSGRGRQKFRESELEKTE